MRIVDALIIALGGVTRAEYLRMCRSYTAGLEQALERINEAKEAMEMRSVALVRESSPGPVVTVRGEWNRVVWCLRVDGVTVDTAISFHTWSASDTARMSDAAEPPSSMTMARERLLARGWVVAHN
jgi:hypothetical protein